MSVAISIFGKEFNSADFCFNPNTSGVLKEIFNKSQEPLKEHPSLLNNEIQPLLEKFIELDEHEFQEKAAAFFKTTLYVAIVAGLVISSFVGTGGLLPLGLIVAWFALQIWIAYDVMQKVDEIESFNPEQKARIFPFTGLMFLGALPVAPLWEVYTRKKRIEEALSTELPIKLEEAIQFFAEGEDTGYIAQTYPRNTGNLDYAHAVQDLFRLQVTCRSFQKHLAQ